jgi:putative transposase
MEGVYKVYLHNPPHYFVQNAMYMVTGSILHKEHLLSDNPRKEFVLQTLLERSNFLRWSLQAWAILNNHYHFIAQAPEDASSLGKLIQQIHSITAIHINKWDQAPGRQVWFNYWDTCLTYEKSYFARLHYVHMNPVKHELVDDPMEYPYCSYGWFIENADGNLKDQVLNQPINKVKVFDDF